MTGGGEVRGEYGTPESGAVLIATTAAGWKYQATQ